MAVALAFFARPGAAHTLPISYLRLVPEADYLHLELIFNPFELALMAEVDDNRDAELDLGELARHGQVVADAVVGALKPVSYTHLRAHETPEHLVCRLLPEKKNKKIKQGLTKSALCRRLDKDEGP